MAPPKGIIVNNSSAAAPQDESAVLAPTPLNPDETALAKPEPVTTVVMEQQPGEAPVTVTMTTEETVVADPAPVTPVTAVPTAGSDAERIAALEQAVMALQSDYKAMMPAFNTLITTNDRIQALLDELQKQNGTAAPAPAPVKAPAAASDSMAQKKEEVAKPAPKPEPAEAQAAPAAGQPMVAGIRVGEHPGKTRLVLDLSTMTPYTATVEGEGRILRIVLPEAAWGVDKAPRGLKSPLVKGWGVQDGPDGGTVLSIDLAKEAKILSRQALKAEGGEPAKIVIDIGPSTPSS